MSGNKVAGREKDISRECQDVLDDVIQRIVQVADPEEIILFGSAARGEMHPDSDLDLLVVKSGVHRRRLAQAIYRQLLGVGRAVDIVVVTPEDVTRYRDAIGLVVGPATREGRTVYAA
jgi:predicted nucleotidyltransferase